MKKFTKILSDGNGGYNLFDDWTTGHDSMMKIFPIIVALPIILVIGLVLPAFLWLLVPLSFVKDNHQNTIYGLGVSLLFFLDYWFGGMLWAVFNLTQLQNVYYFFGALHIVFVLINLIRLFMYVKRDGELPTVLVFIILIVGMYFGYDTFSSMAENMASDTPFFWIEDWYYKSVAEAAESGRYIR